MEDCRREIGGFAGGAVKLLGAQVVIDRIEARGGADAGEPGLGVDLSDIVTRGTPLIRDA
jgi:hypothetical protein